MKEEFEEFIDLFQKGKHEDALKVLNKVYEKRINNFGSDHPNTSEVEFLIALVLRDQCKHNESLHLAKEVCEKRLRPFRIKHPESNVASILSEQGEYTKVLKHYTDMVDKQKSILGPSHEKMFILAKSGEDVLAIYEDIYVLQKEENPDKRTILLTRLNIRVAGQLSEQGKFDEALDILKEINAIHNRRRPNDPDTLHSLELTAEVLSKQGKYKDALEIRKNVHKTKAAISGPDHPGTLTNLYHIGTLLTNQGEFGEGLAILKEVYNKQKNVLGATHSDTLITQENIAELLSDLGKYDEALSIYNVIYEIKKKQANISDTIKVKKKIGTIFLEQGKYVDALSLYKDIADLQKNLSPDHPEVMDTQTQIATTLAFQNKLDDALTIFTKLLEIEQSNFGPEHPYTLGTRYNIATTLRKQGKAGEALEIYFNLLGIQKKSKDVDFTQDFTASILSRIAHIYSLQGRLTEAKDAYEEVYEKRLLSKSADHPTLLTSRKKIATVLARQGKKEQALEIFQEIYEKQISILGKDHPDTLNTEQSLQNLVSVKS